jgi:hypothetical protein
MKLLNGYELTGYLKLQHNIRAHAIETDFRYAPVSKKFILNEFTDYFEKELRRKKLLIPADESNHCEDFSFRGVSYQFALMAMTEGHDLHHLTKPGRSGAAWGIIKYWMNAEFGKEHWINFGAQWKDVEPVVTTVFYWDAMKRREVFLTQQEVATMEYLIV